MKMSEASAETVVVPVVPALLQHAHSVRVGQPIGVVLWANVSDEVAERLAQGTTKLRPQNWKSSDKLSVAVVTALAGGVGEAAV